MTTETAGDRAQRSCHSCGARYPGPVHNCGYVTIPKDRLRELEAIERRIRNDDFSPMRD